MQKITQIIKGLGIIPEDEHYDIVVEVIHTCMEIVAIEGSWEAGSISAFNRIAKEFEIGDADYTEFVKFAEIMSD